MGGMAERNDGDGSFQQPARGLHDARQNPQPATFDLIIGPNGEMRYVGNPKVDGLGYMNHRVTRLTWPAHEVLETPSTSGTGVVEVPAGGPDPGP